MNNTKICIHNYLQKCETGSTPPGLLDFLRGTIALFKYSKIYGYKLYINMDSHPVFKYFEDCEYYLHDGFNNTHQTYELLSQSNARFVDHILHKLFQNGYKFYIITNCFIENEIISNDIDDEVREFIQKILTPSSILKYNLNNVYDSLCISHNENYNCIHIRFGDEFLNSNNIDMNIIYSIYTTIQNIIRENNGTKLLLISDSTNMAKEIIKQNPMLLYWDNKKVHFGYLINYTEEAVLDTLTDIFILSKSKRIYTINISDNYFTTFSPLISKLYNIENIIVHKNSIIQMYMLDPTVLTLYDPGLHKIRLGKDNDGGYVICEIPNISYKILISGGIDNDITFEDSFCKKYNTRCVAFDGTINDIHIDNKNITFVKKNIGKNNGDFTTNLGDLLGNNENIFVKMDIEGAEFEWLISLDDTIFDRIDQMVIEFHFPNSQRATDVFNKINQRFFLVHFHANNYCGYKSHNNVSIPNVFECTYVNKKYLQSPNLNKNKLPTSIDMKNVIEYPDYLIDYPPFVN
jgi:hypothetical protein